ncbi:MAG: ubiquinone biosynthesis protein UbiJ [Cryomorphaceae bacterium]|jgi:ubiquinone biosynthesis protein UbiJ
MLLNILELAINGALEFDPRAHRDLVKLHGKTMTLEIKPIPQRISISPMPHGLEFSNESDSTDVTLSATISALVKIGRDGLDDAELKSGELEINGDAIVGQRFAQILAQLNIDWEGLLAQHIGETPAVLISDGFGRAKEMAQESKSMFSKHLSNLLTNEMGLVAAKSDIEVFLDDVDTLRADADRLQARIQRIQKSI